MPDPLDDAIVIYHAVRLAECDPMSPQEIKDMVNQINKDLGIEAPEPIDKTGMRPDQIAFWEALERGDHLTSEYLYDERPLKPVSDDEL